MGAAAGDMLHQERMEELEAQEVLPLVQSLQPQAEQEATAQRPEETATVEQTKPTPQDQVGLVAAARQLVMEEMGAMEEKAQAEAEAGQHPQAHNQGRVVMAAMAGR